MKNWIKCFVVLIGFATLTAHAQQWGAPVVLSAEGDVATMVRSVALTENLVVVVYVEHETKSGKAVLCRRSGDALTKVSEVPFDSDQKISGASTFALARLTDTKFILCYQDTTPVGKALIGNVVDGKIIWASEAGFTGPNKGEFYDVAALSSEKVVFLFHGASNKRGYVVAADLMEDTLIMGPAVEINPAGPGSQYINQFNSILAMGDGRIIMAWFDLNKGGEGFARAGQVSGTAITMGPTVQYSTANAPYASLVKIDDTRFALAFRDGNNAGKAAVMIGTLTGDAIQFGEKAAVPADGVSDCVTAAPLSGDVFAVSYRNNDAGRESPIHLCKATGTTVKVTKKFVARSGGSNQHLVKLDDKTLLLTHAMPGHKSECIVFSVR